MRTLKLYKQGMQGCWLVAWLTDWDLTICPVSYILWIRKVWQLVLNHDYIADTGWVRHVFRTLWGWILKEFSWICIPGKAFTFFVGKDLPCHTFHIWIYESKQKRLQVFLLIIDVHRFSHGLIPTLTVCGGFLKWWYPQIIHFIRVFPYEPSILGYHHFRKPPCSLMHPIWRCWVLPSFSGASPRRQLHIAIHEGPGWKNMKKPIGIHGNWYIYL